MEEKTMHISKETFAELVKRYDLTICGNACIEDAFAFVSDVLLAEAEATEKAEPYATGYIKRLETAARVAGGYECDISTDELCDMYDELFR